MTIKGGGRDSLKEKTGGEHLNLPQSEHTKRTPQQSRQGKQARLDQVDHIRCAGERASEEERGVPPPAARAPLRLLISAAENAPTKNNGDSGAAAIVFAQPLGKAVGSLF